MGKKTRRAATWGAFGIALLLYMLRLGQGFIRNADQHILIDELTISVFLIFSAAVGALILSYQPRNTIGLLLMSYPVLSIFVDTLLFAVLPQTLPAGEVSFRLLFRSWLGTWSWLVLIVPLFLIPLLFPTGRLISSGWRWALILWALVVFVFIFAITFAEVITDISNPEVVYHNPIGWLSEAASLRIITLFQGLLLVAVAVSGASVVVRYRRAGIRERQQIKWLVFASGLLLVIFASGLLMPSLIDMPWWNPLFNLSLMAIPAAVGAAVLGYRLYDIDIIIRRTLLYGSLTLLLSAIYAGLVIGLQWLFTRLTGQESPVALVLSTLAIVALFNLLRLRVQRFVDRRFFRSPYSAEKMLQDFSRSVRDEVDLTRLAAQLLAMTQDTVEPRAASLWLQERKSRPE